MNFNNKGAVAGFIIMLVVLVVALIAYVLMMPVANPFIDSIAASDADPLSKFLFIGLPFFLFFAIVMGVILK